MTSSLSLHCRSLFPPTFFIQLQQICTLPLPLSSSNIFLSLYFSRSTLSSLSLHCLSLFPLPPQPSWFSCSKSALSPFPQQICTLSHCRCCVSAIAAAALFPLLLSRCCSSSLLLVFTAALFPLLLSRCCSSSPSCCCSLGSVTC